MHVKTAKNGHTGVMCAHGTAYISAQQTTGFLMDLLSDNWEYIQATAAAKAVEMARHSGRMSEIEDFTHDVIQYLIEHAEHYNPRRSQPKTFINMILTYAKKDLLRKMYRMKRRTILQTVELKEAESLTKEENSKSYDIVEFITILPEPIRTITRQVVIEGISAGIIARQHKKRKDEILEMIREVMRPLAIQIGIRTAVSDGADPRTETDPDPREDPQGTTDVPFSG